MTFRREGWIGIGLLIVTPVLFIVLVYFQLFTNAVSALRQIAILVLAAMIVTGSSLVYRGRKSLTDTVPATLPRTDGVQSNQGLGPARFEAELLPKEGLRVGDTVTFKVRFSGKLVNGYLGTHQIPGWQRSWLP